MKKVQCIFVALLFVTATNTIYSQFTQQWIRRYTDTSSVNVTGLRIKTDSLGYIYVLTGGNNDYGFLKYNSNGTLLVRASNSLSGYSIAPQAFYVTSNGDVYITGNAGINFDQWMYTVKFNSSGVLQWNKLYNPDNDDGGTDIKIDKLGNVIVVGGAQRGSSGFGLIVKYNSVGDTIWTRSFNNGQNSASYQNSVIDDSNNIYITGNLGIPGVGMTLKYSPAGSLIWFATHTFDASGSNIGHGIILDLTRNIYVSGTQVSQPFNNIRDYLLKINNTGTVQWSKRSTLISNGGYMTGPVVSTDGGSIYYATMALNDTGVLYSITTLKYNSVGDSQWVKKFDGGVSGSSNFIGNIYLDKFNNIYTCGGANFPTTGNDFTTIKYLATGIQQWVATYSGEFTTSGDLAKDLYIDTSLNVYVTGNCPNLHSATDAVTIKYSQPVGIISNNNQLPQNYKLNQNYPNPFNSSTIITYQLPIKSDIKLKIYNGVGQLVKTLVSTMQNVGYYSIAFNAENLSSGVYFYSMTSNNATIETRKLILIK